MIILRNDAAAQADIALIDHQALSRRNCALRLGKFYNRAIFVHLAQRSALIGLAIARFDAIFLLCFRRLVNPG